MDLRANMKALHYVRRLLRQDTENLLPFPVRVQKPWPAGKAPVPLPRCAPEQAGVPAALLDSLLCELADPQAATHGCLVARGGQIICQGFWAPYAPAFWHVTHSMCKSVTGTAVGMLADEGQLALDERVCEIFPDQCTLRTGRRARGLTVEHLLTMRSGASFRETGAVLEENWVRGFLESDFAFEPGAQFDYNSMNSYLLSAIVQRRTGQTLTEYLAPRLFGPLGFGDVAWESCPQGVNKGGWGMYVYLEDMVKLGCLYLSGGLWQGRRLLSEEWVRAATAVHARSAQGEEYGYQLWPRTADGVYMFNGMFGQYVVMAPDLDLVVAVNAGAGHLFTQSRSYAAVRRFLTALRAGKDGGVPAGEGGRRLAFTLAHLRFGRPVPAPETPPRGLERLRAALARWLLPRAAAPAEARLAADALAGRRFTFAKNDKGLLPVVLAIMNDWYTKGVEAVAFRREGDTLWMDWTESGSLQAVPLGFEQPAPFVLDAGGNRFAAAASARFLYDEDGRPVLKVQVDLLETSSSRIVKLVLGPTGDGVLKLHETPPVTTVLESLQRQGPAAAQALDLFRDVDYLQFCLDRLCNPHLEAHSAAEGQAEQTDAGRP